ncbi:hypothetical protein ACFSJW_12230 [Flavobacterium artemisiae]|uniref:DUF4280 domain-containing protein n=1 Tax=Flavobacterium artemisiae TaxID=2126556 RepID=A0ABW4HDI9_9FLAO
MAESYVPEGTTVICTLMQSGPQKVGRAGRVSYVINTARNTPLLNESDKRISESFNCKNASKFWGGLATLCAGIAIGAILFVAVIATGPVAIVFAVAAFATLGVSAGAGLAAVYKTATDCKTTEDSKWELLHDSVMIEGVKAVLNRSFISCMKGGKVSVIMDQAIAQIAAEQIANNNQNEVNAHVTSQFVMGLITGVTSATPVSLAIASPLSIYFYSKGQIDEETQRAKNQERDNLLQQAKDAFVIQTEVSGAGTVGGFIDGVNEVTKINQALNTEVAEYGAQAAARETAGDLAGAANAALAQDIASRSYQTPWKGMLKGFRYELAAGVANFVIDTGSNSYEDEMHKGALREAQDSDEKDRNNNIGIIATLK